MLTSDLASSPYNRIISLSAFSSLNIKRIIQQEPKLAGVSEQQAINSRELAMCNFVPIVT